MCGIVAYIGNKEAQPLLLDGLRRLEYRGYDSSGMAILNGKLHVSKKVGRITNLEEILSTSPLAGTIGISHTRWATHGEPNDTNAHPHLDASKKLALVHNGVVENYQALKRKLQAAGHVFESQTDTEILAHLVGQTYDTLPPATLNRLETALKIALKQVQGTYGVVVVHADEPDLLVGARRGSPLVLGIGQDEEKGAPKEYFLASDVSAIVAHTQKVVYLKDFDLISLTSNSFSIKSITDKPSEFEISQIDYRSEDADLGTFPHYMIKEIFEQPASIENATRGRTNVEEASAVLGGLNMSPQELREVERIVITACGTALHAGIIGEHIIETLANIPVEIDFASEFRYRNCPMDRRTLVIVVSQSGETADTLGALREARRKGFRVLGICNNVGSTIARETDGGVYMHAGPEIGVAATKSFTSQVTIFALLGLLLGRMRFLSFSHGAEFIEGIDALPDQITEVLKQADKIKAIADKYKDAKSMLYFGRNMQYGVALEGALKMKEISYIHAEGYPAAELKHGVIAMIDHQTPSIFIVPHDSLRSKNVSTMQEVKARRGPIIAIATEGDEEVASIADETIFIPAAHECLLPIISIIPLQLFSYYTAVLLNRDVDKPRNLAKSVTVE
ncbi:MAG: glutamine--fructose-6-phosphate transaminase (isomerizing) [Candidatus Methylacidiphilales bacterium]|nr:glutamine--fructose-6-phosphate transaminase (isomerizing) [Candidatus Methylacidiphilales bacterium]